MGKNNYLFSKYLQYTYVKPGIALGPGVTMLSQTAVALLSLDFSVESREHSASKLTNTHLIRIHVRCRDEMLPGSFWVCGALWAVFLGHGVMELLLVSR